MKLSKKISAIFLLLISQICLATNLQLNPIKIDFAPGQQITSMQITNKDEQPIVLQLSVKKWQQDKAGKEQYSTSDDLLVTPPIFTLAAHQTQIVRLAIMKPLNLSSEQSYRLIVREVSSGVKKSDKNKLQLVMQFILPVFVEPITKASKQINYKILKTKTNKQTVIVMNQSNHHIVVTSITIKDKSGNTVGVLDKLGQYILSHAQSQFIIPVTKGDTAKTAVIKSIG